MKRIILFFGCLFSLITSRSYAQSIDLVPGIEYEIGNIDVSGSGNLDNSVIILLSGLQIGDKVTFPGEDIQNAVKKLWQQKLFNEAKTTQASGAIPCSGIIFL